jgi:uncharacterized protein
MKLRTPEHDFDWSESKAKLNVRKHGVSFVSAAAVFDDPLHSTRYDWLHSDVEDRWITIGQIPNGPLLSVIHTSNEPPECDTLVRIISARRANAHERFIYEMRGYMVREVLADDLDFGGGDPKQFFRGGHMSVDNGVRRMSIFLDFDLLKYFLIRAATLDEGPTDLINNILKRERERLELEKAQSAVR